MKEGSVATVRTLDLTTRQGARVVLTVVGPHNAGCVLVAQNVVDAPAAKQGFHYLDKKETNSHAAATAT